AYCAVSGWRRHQLSMFAMTVVSSTTLCPLGGRSGIDWAVIFRLRPSLGAISYTRSYSILDRSRLTPPPKNGGCRFFCLF
ncbi:hypothetical protein BGY98DRAFT_1021118, partial [Russula aff. rugulosa BPL654]